MHVECYLIHVVSGQRTQWTYGSVWMQKMICKLLIVSLNILD